MRWPGGEVPTEQVRGRFRLRGRDRGAHPLTRVDPTMSWTRISAAHVRDRPPSLGNAAVQHGPGVSRRTAGGFVHGADHGYRAGLDLLSRRRFTVLESEQAEAETLAARQATATAKPPACWESTKR